MVALDTNILIDLLVKSQPGHQKGVRWLERIEGPLATTPISLGELLRLLTHPRVFPSPMDLRTAIELIDGFLSEYGVAVLQESDEWWKDLRQFQGLSIKGNEIFDARIALCLKFNGVKELATYDSDFLKYSFLRIISP